MKSSLFLLSLLAFSMSLIHGQTPAAPPIAQPFERGVRVLISAAKPAVIKGGDWDDKHQRIAITAKFSNIDTRQSYNNYSATLYGLGQSAENRKVIKVLLHEKIPLTLAPLKELAHECKEIHTQFDKTGATFGYFYDGWILIVKDSEGKVVFVKSTSPTLEKLVDKVDKLSLNSTYSKLLEPMDEAG